MAKRKFQRREWAVLVIGLFMIVVIGSKPIGRFMREKENSASLVIKAQRNLQLAQDLRLTIESDRSGQEALFSVISQRSPSFDLYNFTSKCLKDLKLYARATVKSAGGPGTRGADAVNLTLSGVSMDELRSFLHQMYSSNNLIVLKQLRSLQPAADGKGLDVQIDFISPKKS